MSTTRPVIASVIALGLVMVSDRSVLAQPAHLGSVYLSAGVSFPHQAVPGNATKPPFAAPGGTTIGWLAGGGVFVSPRVSTEGEVSSTGVMRSRQSGRGFVEVSDRRDRFVSLGLKGHLPVHRLVFVEPVVGVVLILPGDTAMQTSNFTPSGALTPPQVEWADLGLRSASWSRWRRCSTTCGAIASRRWEAHRCLCARRATEPGACGGRASSTHFAALRTWRAAS